MRRVLVTGASGFMGRHLCNALLRRGDFVVALQRDQGGGGVNWGCSALVCGGFGEVERAVAEYEVDTVVHLAAQTQVSTAVADPVGTLEANARGTWLVLDACRRQKVRRVVVASSDKAYGDWIVPYSEAQPLVPHGIYATSKAVGDMVAQAYVKEYAMSVAIARCGNLFGPGHTNYSTLIPGTIRSVLKGERPVLRSDGGPRRDFLFVEDAVDAYVKLVDSDEVGPFNFGTGRPARVLDVVEEILRVMGSTLTPVIQTNLATAVEIQDQFLDWQKAARALDWEPKHDLASGLVKTVEWYRGVFGG